MGLFSIFSKGPEAYEKKGDAALERGTFGSAKIEYEKALEKLNPRDEIQGPVFHRIREKLAKSIESLVAQHLERAEQLVEAESPGDAITYFTLARDLTLNSELKASLGQRIVGLSVAAAPPPAPDNEEFHDLESHPAPGSDLDEFYALIGTYPDDIADEYAEYGDAFIHGFILLNQGEFKEAVVHLEEAMHSQDNQVTHIHLELAGALISLDDFTRAETLLTEYLDLYPDSLPGISHFCDLLWIQKRFNDAHAFLDTLALPLKSTSGFCMLRGRTFFLEQRFDEAQAVYQEFLNIGQWVEPIGRALAESLAAGGKPEQARSIVTTLLNTCTGCGQKPRTEDKLLYAELSIQMQDISEDVVEALLAGAAERPDLAAACLGLTARAFKILGNDQEALRYKTMAEEISNS